MRCLAGGRIRAGCELVELWPKLSGLIAPLKAHPEVVVAAAFLIAGAWIVWQMRREIKWPTLLKNDKRGQQTTIAEPEPSTTTTTVPEGGPVASDFVHCSVFAPPRVTPREIFKVQAHLHVFRDTPRAYREAARIDRAANLLGHRSLPMPIARGAAVELLLVCPDLIIERPWRQLTWEGTPTNEVFEVEVPADPAPDCIEGMLNVSVDSIPVGDIEFKLYVASAAPLGTEGSAETRAFRYESAFVSYSRRDFERVSIIAQALEVQQTKLVLDVTTLEPGEEWAKQLPALISRADVFCLIWTHNAAKSEWVDKEARWAVELYESSNPHRPRIRPITLDRPVPRPPDYLRKFHFDSPFLAQRTAHKAPLFDEDP